VNTNCHAPAFLAQRYAGKHPSPKPEGERFGENRLATYLISDSVVLISNRHRAIAGEKNAIGVSLAPLMKPSMKSCTVYALADCNSSRLDDIANLHRLQAWGDVHFSDSVWRKD
jgi:hypothetical protein